MLGLIIAGWMFSPTYLTYTDGAPHPLSQLHKATLIGDESARIVSSDPESAEARQAEASGGSVACGMNHGTLNIVSYKGNFYLIGAAHPFYKDGFLKCNDGFGSFYPDDHYYDGSSEYAAGGSNIVFNRPITYSLPPLNQETAEKFPGRIVYDSSRNLNDLAILRIRDGDFMERQVGGYRRFMVLSEAPADELMSLSRKENIQIIAARKNFYKKYEVGIEDDCQVEPSRVKGLLKHSCDTGQGSSGSALTYTSKSGQLVAIGFHYGSVGVDVPKLIQDPNSSDGNYFISSEQVLSVISDLDSE